MVPLHVYSSEPDAACEMRETIQDPRCRVVSVASNQLLGRVVVVARIECTVLGAFHNSTESERHDNLFHPIFF